MRQIVLLEPGRFEERDVSAPEAAPGEALVRIRSVGVCGSDFHAFYGNHPVYTYPRVLGHEISGEVISVPAAQRNIRPGDHCAVEPYIACGGCGPCRLGRTNCCERLRVLGIHVDGAMSGLLSVPVNLLHASHQLSFDQLALVETLGIGAQAVTRCGLKEGEQALVVGAGPIGLAVIQFASAAGAQVLVIEKSESRREFARQFTGEVYENAGDLLGDVVFDATGSAASMAASLSQVAPGGRLVFVGLTREAVPLNDALFHVREVTLFASRNSCHQFPRIIGMIERGEIDTAPWINARFALRDVPNTFEGLTKRTDVVKAIIEVSDEDV